MVNSGNINLGEGASGRVGSPSESLAQAVALRQYLSTIRNNVPKCLRQHDGMLGSDQVCFGEEA